MSDEVVTVNNLTVMFGDFAAVKDVTFQVQAGEIFGFLGANGAGKTTTIRVICGLQRPTSGKVEVCGVPLTHDTQSVEQIKNAVGYMSQKFTLYQDLTVKENLEFAANLRKLKKSYFEARKKELFDFIQFSLSEKELVGNLSGGIKQQVSLIASMLHDPRVVFLDEPTAGVSPASRARFWDLIRSLSKKGTTVFVTTHYLDEAEQCDRIALMRAGELIALDTPAALKSFAFPTGMYEITTGSMSIKKIKEISGVRYAEVYGLRTHLAFETVESQERGLAALSNETSVQAIAPTLEDVFLKLVETP